MVPPILRKAPISLGAHLITVHYRQFWIRYMAGLFSFIFFFFLFQISFRYFQKRSSFDQSFHTYTLEWDSKFMRFYTDSRLHAMLETQVQGQSLGAKKKSFWDKAGFPLTAFNGSSGAEVVVTDPWEGSSYMAPFDQCKYRSAPLFIYRNWPVTCSHLAFYLIIDLAAGGTSGWFPDNKGGKPWYDGSLCMFSFFCSLNRQKKI